MNNLTDWIEQEGVDKFIRVFSVPEHCAHCPAAEECSVDSSGLIQCRDAFALWAEEEVSPTRTLDWDNAVALSRIANALGTIAEQIVKDPMTNQMKLAKRD